MHEKNKIRTRQRVTFFKLTYLFQLRLITILWWLLPYIYMSQPWVYMCSSILNPPPTSLSTPSLWVVPEYQLWVPCFMHTKKTKLALKFVFFFKSARATCPAVKVIMSVMCLWVYVFLKICLRLHRLNMGYQTCFSLLMFQTLKVFSEHAENVNNG